MSRHWPTWVEINLSNVRHNVEVVKRRIGRDVCLMAIVKAEANGHGGYEIAEAALESGADKLGVASADEGIALRERGITAPILILGLSFCEAAADIVSYDLMQTVCDESLAFAISREAVRQNRTAFVNVKVNTGMNRIGVEPENAVRLIKNIREYPNIYIEGIFTHLATSYAEREYTGMQFGKFMQVLNSLEAEGIHIPFKHCCNTGGVMNFPEMYLNQVRVGAMLTTPFKSLDSDMDMDIRECMEFKSKVIFVRELEPGMSVGYNRMYIADKKCRIAVVSAGWGDGVPRELTNKGHVLIGQKRCPLRGRVCSDQIFADVTDVDGVRPGDEAVIIGRQGDECISAWEWGEALGGVSSPVTLRSFITQRVERKYIDQ